MMVTAVVLTLGAALAFPASGAAAAVGEQGDVRVMVADHRPGPDDSPGRDLLTRIKDAVRFCPFGGYRDRYDAATGNGFTSAGACIAHAVRGGTQATLKLTGTTYFCADHPGEYCWGQITGSGLEAGSTVVTIAPDQAWPAAATVDASGTVNTTAQIPCTYTVDALFYAQAFAPGDVQIRSRPITSPCPSD